LPTLKHLDGDEFVTLVKSQTDKDTLTVVFVENNLSAEDFSQCKLNTKTCFENLRSLKDKTYLSSVQRPVDSIISAFDNHKAVTVSGEDNLNEIDAAEGQNVIVVYFDDSEGGADFYKHGTEYLIF
jgi:hypothetical protein